MLWVPFRRPKASVICMGLSMPTSTQTRGSDQIKKEFSTSLTTLCDS